MTFTGQSASLYAIKNQATRLVTDHATGIPAEHAHMGDDTPRPMTTTLQRPHGWHLAELLGLHRKGSPSRIGGARLDNRERLFGDGMSPHAERKKELKNMMKNIQADRSRRRPILWWIAAAVAVIAVIIAVFMNTDTGRRLTAEATDEAPQSELHLSEYAQPKQLWISKLETAFWASTARHIHPTKNPVQQVLEELGRADVYNRGHYGSTPLAPRELFEQKWGRDSQPAPVPFFQQNFGPGEEPRFEAPRGYQPSELDPGVLSGIAPAAPQPADQRSDR